VRLEENGLQDNRFRKSERLLKSSEFRRVFAEGVKIITPTLVFHAALNQLPGPRLGLAVSKRVGKAVKRNFVKRRIREAFRLSKGRFPVGYDLVVYPRKGVFDKEFEDYLKSFGMLLAKLERAEQRKKTHRGGNE